MGARLIQGGLHRESRRSAFASLRETGVFIGITAGVMCPVLLVYAVIAADRRSDLAEIKARPASVIDSARVLGWADLPDSKLSEGPVQMLGYMMDGYEPVPDGRRVRTFILMPDAGHILHPAHRIPEEMVEVWLRAGDSLPYANRSLVWAAGRLHRVRGKAKDGAASWLLFDASVQKAEERDLARWFVH